MPEYLAPDVYVEEIDTGSKPIEGVSTSTAGMIGVTERGPVDVPILVTSYGEFTRWFGEALNPADYPNHCFLPHAVEGFFTNGGKRVYVVRIVNSAAADRSTLRLFSRNVATPVSTTLLGGAASGSSAVVALSGTGLTSPKWIQIGDGSTAEFRQITGAPAAGNDVAVRLPLAFGYDPLLPPSTSITSRSLRSPSTTR